MAVQRLAASRGCRVGQINQSHLEALKIFFQWIGNSRGELRWPHGLVASRIFAAILPYREKPHCVVKKNEYFYRFFFFSMFLPFTSGWSISCQNYRNKLKFKREKWRWTQDWSLGRPVIRPKSKPIFSWKFILNLHYAFSQQRPDYWLCADATGQGILYLNHRISISHGFTNVKKVLFSFLLAFKVVKFLSTLKYSYLLRRQSAMASLIWVNFGFSPSEILNFELRKRKLLSSKRVELQYFQYDHRIPHFYMKLVWKNKNWGAY